MFSLGLTFFPIYIVFILIINDFSKCEHFIHTSYDGTSAMYRNCYLLSKRGANYQNQFSENIDTYMHYCIRNYTSSQRFKLGYCAAGGRITFQTLYKQRMYHSNRYFKYERSLSFIIIERDFDWLFENHISIDIIDLYGQYRDLRQRNDSTASKLDKTVVCVCTDFESKYYFKKCHDLFLFYHRFWTKL